MPKEKTWAEMTPKRIDIYDKLEKLGKPKKKKTNTNNTWSENIIIQYINHS